MTPVPIPGDPDDMIRAEVRLAQLMGRDLNVSINPDTLRLFIQARWDRVSSLAHKIHEDVS